MMLVRPWATVSWISRASRSRSAAIPAWCERWASRSRLRSNSSISRPRSRLCSTTLVIHRPSSTVSAIPSSVSGRMPSTSAPSLPLLIHTSTGGTRLAKSTTAMPSEVGRLISSIGQIANSANALARSSAAATANSTSRPRANQRLRGGFSPLRSSGRPNAAYQGTIRVSAATAPATRPGAACEVSSSPAVTT